MVGGRWWVGLPVTAGGARWSLCCSVRRVRYRRFNCSSHGLIASGATPCPSHVPRVAATGQARAQVVWILPRILSLKRPSENLSPQELWPARPTQSAWRVHGSQRRSPLVSATREPPSPFSASPQASRGVHSARRPLPMAPPPAPPPSADDGDDGTAQRRGASYAAEAKRLDGIVADPAVVTVSSLDSRRLKWVARCALRWKRTAWVVPLITKVGRYP